MAGLPARRSPWLVGMCVVTFDINVGQSMTTLVPEGILTAQEKSDVAFHSFPDSLSWELNSKSGIRDTSFFFRVRRTQHKRGPAAGAAASAASAEEAPAAGSSAAQAGFLYGFAFCRQRQDERLQRGGEQHAVVVLSEQPFSSVLTPVSQVVGPLYFADGAAALDEVYEEVLAWPPPVPGAAMQLPLCATTISARIPSFRALPPPQPAVDAAVQAALTRRASRSLASRRSQGSLTDELQPYAPPPPGCGAAGSNGSPHASSDNLAAAGPGPGSAPGSAAPSPQRPVSQGLRRNLSASSSGSLQALAAASTSGRQDSGVLLPSGVSRLSLQSAGSGFARAGSLGSPGTGGDEGAAHGAFGELDVYTPLAGVSQHLWTLWEVALTGSPLLVVSPSAQDACAAVAALVALVAPLPYAADFRPYYTLHDPDFKHLAGGAVPEGPAAARLPALLGVTNLYFVKALAHWPNVLGTGQREGGGSGGAGGGGSGTSAGAPGGSAGATGRGGGGFLQGFRQRRTAAQGPAALLQEQTAALWARYKPCLAPDTALLATVVSAAGGAEARPAGLMGGAGGAGAGGDRKAGSGTAASRALRRHFADLTAAFLAPFQPYLAPGPDGRVPRFSLPAFLADSVGSVAVLPPQLAARLPPGSGRNPQAQQLEPLHALYRAFVAGPNFAYWFAERLRPVEHLLAPAAAGSGALPAAIAEAGPSAAGGASAEEVELVQAFVSLEAQLAAALSRQEAAEGGGGAGGGGAGAGGDPDPLRDLKAAALDAFFAMPFDLKQALVSSPLRQELLQRIAWTEGQRKTLQKLAAGLV